MNKKIIYIVVLLIIIVAGLFAFKTDNSSEIKFGLIVGLAGDYAIVGESFARGAELAQEQWNRNNPNRIISMVKEDDRFDAKAGLSAYKKLTSIDNIDALINMTTITIDALYDEVVENGMPVALGFEQGIESKNDNIVQLWPGTVPAEKELGKYIKSEGFKNVVVFVDKGSSAFQRFADGFKSGYESSVTEITVGPDSGDIKSSALKVLGTNPDAIVFIVSSRVGASLIRELNIISNQQYQFVFDANIQTGFVEYKNILGDTNLLNGSIVYTVPNIYREEFVNSYREKYGSEPMIGSETGYNAFMLLAINYDKNREVWIKNMQNAEFLGADGQIVFDETGVRLPDLKIGTIENGELPL